MGLGCCNRHSPRRGAAIATVGAGALQSGAAIKDSIRFGKNLDAGYRGEFLNLLGNQQALGASSAGAQAGVATQMGNTISANNNSAGTAQANSILARGNNNPFANALSLAGGAAFGLRK